MLTFVGRRFELSQLTAALNDVRAGGETPGKCLLLRGRRRVGKSRLVETFCEQAGVPFLFYAAAGASTGLELERFQEAAQESSLPGRELLHEVPPTNWNAALRLLTEMVPNNQPSIVVLDELPYLIAADPAFEGILQAQWDRQLSKKPMLLIIIGSDMSMMEQINTYGRPFFQRGTPMLLDALSPREVGEALKLNAVAAFDAYLVTGGLPLICAAWPVGKPAATAMASLIESPISPLIVSADLSLAAEFPPDSQARAVLTAIGSGERTSALIQRAADIPTTSFHRALHLLTERRIIIGDLPLSTRPAKEMRYRIIDPYLRFWLTFLGPHIDEINRGRADITMARIKRGWASWRGRAVEPVVRDALSRGLPNHDSDWLEDAFASVGAYWTRTNDVEVDIIGADRAPIAKKIVFVGSIKWRDNKTFSSGDVAELIVARDRVPGAPVDTPLIAVARQGDPVAGVDGFFTADDLLAAYP